MKVSATPLLLLLLLALLSALDASAASFNGVVRSATDSKPTVFTLRQPSENAFSFQTRSSSAAPLVIQAASSTTSASGSGSGSSSSSSGSGALPPATATVTPPTLRQTSAPATPGGSCRWEGVVVRHNSAKYFAGRAHRRGSIFGECRHGVLTCYEDSGLADTETTQHTQIKCERRAVDERQRDLDMEDRAAPSSSSSTTTTTNTTLPKQPAN